MKLLAAITLPIVATLGYNLYSVSSLSLPPEEILKKGDDWEIRRKSPYITSTIYIKASSHLDALAQGRNLLDPFIGGYNTRLKSIDTYSPIVIWEENSMTTSWKDTSFKAYGVQYILSNKYVTDRLPKPNNPSIYIKEHSDFTVHAVKKFNGYLNSQIIEQEIENLLEILKKQNMRTKINANFEIRQYNNKYTLFWRRNEILIELENSD